MQKGYEEGKKRGVGFRYHRETGEKLILKETSAHVGKYRKKSRTAAILKKLKKGKVNIHLQSTAKGTFSVKRKPQ